MSATTAIRPGALPGAVGDATLVARAKRGDRQAFGALADRHATQVRRVVFRITRNCDAAYDVVQDALLLAWLNIGRFQGRSRFSTWLIRIGINEAYRGLRRGRFELATSPDELTESQTASSSEPAQLAESHAFLEDLERALGELPLDRRTAVVLRDVEGLTTAEAADALGISQRALKSRLHRGRMALRDELHAHLVDDDG